MAGMFEHGAKTDKASTATFKSQLNKVYGWYAGGFFAFVLVLAVLEQMGLPKEWIGFIFLLATIGLYAGTPKSGNAYRSTGRPRVSAVLPMASIVRASLSRAVSWATAATTAASLLSSARSVANARNRPRSPIARIIWAAFTRSGPTPFSTCGGGRNAT